MMDQDTKKLVLAMVRAIADKLVIVIDP